jgi:hypothetical protein
MLKRCSIAVLLLLAGCPQREVSRVSTVQSKEQEKTIPVEITRDIDILFVIDNSGSMKDEQDSLIANFPNFIGFLQTIEGGLPNVHIGIVSTDMGANAGIQNCEQPQGDQGNLQATARPPLPPAMNLCDDGMMVNVNVPGPEPYIIDISDGNEMMPGRITNYPMGKLAETFSCIAALGVNGCGFEMPLESMMRALDNNPANAGFLRENAFLAIIFLGDEDDCSASNYDLFDRSASSVPTLGPLTSYRCFEFGVQCNPDDRFLEGLRADCVPRENSPYIYNVQRYVDFIKSLKDDDGKIIVAAIQGVSAGTGLPEPVNVGPSNDEAMNPTLLPVCQSAGLGEAVPAIRLKAFLDAFPNRNTMTTICQDDLSGALQQIAELVREVIGNPCLEGNLKLDDNGVPLCTVTDITNKNTPEQVETVIRHCTSVATAIEEAPCWYVESDPMECAGTNNPTQLKLTVERNGAQVPVGTVVEVRCESM